MLHFMERTCIYSGRLTTEKVALSLCYYMKGKGDIVGRRSVSMAQRRPPLVHTLEELIDPSHLVDILDLPSGNWHIGRERIEGGVSGAMIERLMIFDIPHHSKSVVIKQIDPETNWLMIAAGDRSCREIMLTQSALWDRLTDVVTIPVLGTALLEDGTGALLLEDVASEVLPASLCYEPSPQSGSLIDNIIEGFARLHATFWEDPLIRQEQWLASPHDAIFFLTPDAIASSGLTYEGQSYGAAAIRMWSRLWPLINEKDAAALRAVIINPEALIASVLAAPLTLAHGDSWIANLGMRDDRLILLDWAMVTSGPATYDSLWFAHTWHALDPDDILTRHRAALLKYGVQDVQDDATWELLTDLAWVRTTLLGIEWLVRDVIGAQTDAEDRMALERLHFWCNKAASIIRARGWG
jgi:Phosphotransferase enzyme family